MGVHQCRGLTVILDRPDDELVVRAARIRRDGLDHHAPSTCSVGETVAFCCTPFSL